MRTHGAALIGAGAADCLLDQIKCGDAFERLVRNWRRSSFGDIKELSSQMLPTKYERDGVARAWVIGNVLVSRIAVALHDPAIA